LDFRLSPEEHAYKRFPLKFFSDNRKSAIQNLKLAGLSVIAFVFVAVEAVAEAQQQTTVPKIGLLRARLAASGTSLDGLMRELRVLGYIGGKNVIIESRSAEGKLDRLPALADELVRLKVDVLVTPSSVEALAAKNATTIIPIVCLNLGDAIAYGLVDSLARPGGNITGFTSIGAELAGKRLELLKEIVPKLLRVAVLWNPLNIGAAQEWKESQLPARDLGLQLHSMEVSSADKFDAAFKEATKAGSAAVAVTRSTLNNSYQKRIADLTSKNRLPAITSRRDFVESGGLMSYGADQAEPYRRAAAYVDKILKGAKLADLPVERPTKFELVINLKTAKQIGLTIPPSVLARADKVIQ
jgi:putative ABC transport system substrate-binding protein